MTRNTMIVLIIVVVLLPAVLAVLFAQNLINTAAIEITILFALVLVTIIYANRTSAIAKVTKQQADASVKMAEEMRDARFAALKPIVAIDWIAGERGQAITPYFKNIGKGPALNVKCYCTHTRFTFNDKQERTTLEDGKREQITLLTEEFDFQDWTGFAINCDYQSSYGENFRSILRFKTEQERNLGISDLK